MVMGLLFSAYGRSVVSSFFMLCAIFLAIGGSRYDNDLYKVFYIHGEFGN